jgi:hypothetical protein
MPEFGATTTALLAIARDVADDRALAEQICRACVVGLGVDGAALSLLTASPARHTLHASDRTAQMLEELQFSLGEGVCIEAATTGRAVFVTDMHDTREVTRWPVFAAAVIEHTDVRALYALPLQWGTTNLGVLDVYRRVPLGLKDAQRRDALSAADTAALMMLTLRTEPTPESSTGAAPGAELGGSSWLEPVASGRAEVHQATGMVLVQLRVSAADALARMRAYAFAHQRLLIDVADDVVARRLDFSNERGRDPDTERDGEPYGDTGRDGDDVRGMP